MSNLKAYRVFQDEEEDTKLVFDFSEEEAKVNFHKLLNDWDLECTYSQRDEAFDKYAEGDKPYHLDQTKKENDIRFYNEGWWKGTQDDRCSECDNGIYESIPESQIVCSDCECCGNCAMDNSEDEDCNCDCLKYKLSLDGLELINGDCLDVLDRFIKEGIKFDAIICDPPYGVTNCPWDKFIHPSTINTKLKKLLKKNAALLLFGQEPFSSAMRVSSLKDLYKYDIYWIKNRKTNHLNAKKQPLRNVENISIFYENQCTYKPQVSEGHKPLNNYTKHNSDGITLGKTKKGISGGGQTIRQPSNSIYFDTVSNDKSGEKRYQPTQKPIALMKYLVRTYTSEGDLVLDFTMGSGTTGLACKLLNRKFVGIELNEDYYKSAVQRLK